jgi:16S rRNA processing protein RimM
MNTEELISIGRIGSSVGIRGEVRVNLYSRDSNNLKEGKVLLLKRAKEILSAEVERVRYQKDRPVVKLKGVDDRNAAEAIRGLEVYIEADELEPLPEGEHYVRNIIGCRVIDIAGETGDKEIGVLRDVIQNTAQSILEVETADGKTVLIPAVDEFMRGIDEEEGIIKVELIPGFI